MLRLFRRSAAVAAGAVGALAYIHSARDQNGERRERDPLRESETKEKINTAPLTKPSHTHTLTHTHTHSLTHPPLSIYRRSAAAACAVLAEGVRAAPLLCRRRCGQGKVTRALPVMFLSTSLPPLSPSPLRPVRHRGRRISLHHAMLAESTSLPSLPLSLSLLCTRRTSRSSPTGVTPDSGPSAVSRPRCLRNPSASSAPARSPCSRPERKNAVLLSSQRAALPSDPRRRPLLSTLRLRAARLSSAPLETS